MSEEQISVHGHDGLLLMLDFAVKTRRRRLWSQTLCAFECRAHHPDSSTMATVSGTAMNTRGPSSQTGVTPLSHDVHMNQSRATALILTDNAVSFYRHKSDKQLD